MAARISLVKAVLKSPEILEEAKEVDPAVLLALVMKKEFPKLPDNIINKVVPTWKPVDSESLPWNRRRRRTIERAKRIIIHLYSGKDQKSWKQLEKNGTVVICVDRVLDPKMDMLNDDLTLYCTCSSAQLLVRRCRSWEDLHAEACQHADMLMMAAQHQFAAKSSPMDWSLWTTSSWKWLKMMSRCCSGWSCCIWQRRLIEHHGATEFSLFWSNRKIQVNTALKLKFRKRSSWASGGLKNGGRFRVPTPCNWPDLSRGHMDTAGRSQQRSLTTWMDWSSWKVERRLQI